MCASFLVEATFNWRDVYIRIIWEMHRDAVYYNASAPFYDRTREGSLRWRRTTFCGGDINSTRTFHGVFEAVAINIAGLQ